MRSTIVLVAALAAVVAFTTITTPVAAVNGVCRALAMSGGGDKAAYEAGVLQGLLDNLPAEETSWDVVTGISAGSTLTATFAVFPIGQEQNAVSLAYDIIASLNQTSIYRQWPGGVLEGLLAHSSLFDSTPLRDMITRELSAQTLSSDRLTCMGASHLRSGGFQRFCSPEFVNIESIVNATVASAAIPGVFLAQTYKGETYVDGGTLVNVDVTGAIEGCLSLGYNESQIIVDTIECSGTQTIAPLPAGDESKLTVIPILLRALQMRQYWRDEDDYNAAMDAYPQATFRYRIHPSVPISGSGISFNQTQMLEMEALGENDAAAAVHAGKAKNLHLTRA